MINSTLTRKLTGVVAGTVTAALVLAGCSSASDTETEVVARDAGSSEQWPRTFTNADGSETVIEAEPERIVSTVSVTGTLLSIGAPVVASTTGGDSKFFGQWEEVATEQGVEELFPAGTVDLEAIMGQAPDLIVMAGTGRDSMADQFEQLSQIAPTIIVDNGGQTWQDLAEDLGEATGHEEGAAEAVEEFDALVAEVAGEIEVPEGTVNIISYTGPGETNQIARAGSAQAGILTELGFTLEDPPVEWHTQPQARPDFVWATYERLTELTGDTTFILSRDDEGARAFAEDPVLVVLPSVKNGAVYGLGENSFRIDKYSATEIVESVRTNFAK